MARFRLLYNVHEDIDLRYFFQDRIHVPNCEKVEITVVMVSGARFLFVESIVLDCQTVNK